MRGYIRASLFSRGCPSRQRFPLLAFLSRADPDGTFSDAADGIALRSETFGLFRTLAISLVGCRRFIRWNGVAIRFLAALRCAYYGTGLRVHLVDDEIPPALVVWVEARGLGNY